MTRKQYLLTHFRQLGSVWVMSTLIGLCLLLLRDLSASFMVLSLALAFTFFCASCKELNQLGNYKDERFMLNTIFWFGAAGFGLISLMMRSSTGIVVATIIQSAINVFVLWIMVWYITGVRMSYQKTLE